MHRLGWSPPGASPHMGALWTLCEIAWTWASVLLMLAMLLAWLATRRGGTVTAWSVAVPAAGYQLVSKLVFSGSVLALASLSAASQLGFPVKVTDIMLVETALKIALTFCLLGFVAPRFSSLLTEP
jgi:hypothetical protein